MPLAVPILRALYVFLNVFETYKTLKLPPPSALSGQTTVLAISARKRARNGCMIVSSASSPGHGDARLIYTNAAVPITAPVDMVH